MAPISPATLCRKHAQRICRKSGLLPTSNSKPGRRLPFMRPQMVKVRSWIQHQIASGRYHGRLIANFDQVWSLQFRPLARTLQQRAKVDEHARSQSMRRIRHIIERVLDRPFTESLDGDSMEDASRCARVQGGEAAMAGVEGWRLPHTVTTVSWADGSLSRAFITCRADCLSESQRCQANQAPGGIHSNCTSCTSCRTQALFCKVHGSFEGFMDLLNTLPAGWNLYLDVEYKCIRMLFLAG